MTKTTTKKIHKTITRERPATTVGTTKQVLLAVAFFEGAAVMVIELLGAKIIAPFYGRTFRYNALFPVEKFTGAHFAPVDEIQLQDALVLTDDKPNLELLNAPTILDWRKTK
jgi:hypothetical protein